MIRSYNITYEDKSDLEALQPEAYGHPGDRTLVQVFSGVMEERVLEALLDDLAEIFPGAPVVGATTAGEIRDGEAVEGTILVNVTLFDETTVRSGLVRDNDDLADAGRRLGESAFQEGAGAAIVLGCGIKNGGTLFLGDLLRSVGEVMPEAVIGGGQAGDNGEGRRTLVFTQDGITDSGVAAASLAGPSLVVNNTYNLSWVPIGKRMTITGAQGSTVYSIDNQSPYDIYSHYLGQEVADNLPLSAADYPMMLERDGVMLAAHATKVNDDGSFNYIYPFHAGEQVRFGFCHAGLLALGAGQTYEALHEKNVQAAFVYSCVSRKWILGADVQVELEPVGNLGVTAGFFCYGEYFHHKESGPLFVSQTMTVLTLAEGDEEGDGEDKSVSMPDYSDRESRQFRTLRVLHRLVETSAREIEEMNHELAGLARLDSLTGLANRRQFDERLATEVRRSGRSGAPLSLILLDADYFKVYNDTYGHVMGDDCLRGIAEVLRGKTRRPSDITARYGGEEFVCILPVTTHEGALVIAEEIRQGVIGLDIPHSGSEVAGVVTASLGVVTVRCDKSTRPKDIVALCDKQLYAAKEGGRNRVVGKDLTGVLPSPD